MQIMSLLYFVLTLELNGKVTVANCFHIEFIYIIIDMPYLSYLYNTGRVMARHILFIIQYDTK